jgi:hypothetical protein
VFPEGARVRDAVTGAQATVARGVVTIASGPSGVVLLEAVQPAP